MPGVFGGVTGAERHSRCQLLEGYAAIWLNPVGTPKVGNEAQHAGDRTLEQEIQRISINCMYYDIISYTIHTCRLWCRPRMCPNLNQARFPRRAWVFDVRWAATIGSLPQEHLGTGRQNSVYIKFKRANDECMSNILFSNSTDCQLHSGSIPYRARNACHG